MNIENSNNMIFDSFSVKICINLGESKLNKNKWKWKIIILGVEIFKQIRCEMKNKIGADSNYYGCEIVRN